MFYFPDSFPGQIEALVTELTKPLTADSESTHLMISIGHSSAMATAFGAAVMCLNQVYYTKAVENPPVLNPFTEMSPQIDALNSMALKNVTAAAAEQTAGVQSQVRYGAFHVIHPN